MTFKEAVEIAGEIITSFAIVIGGWWTYHRFIKQREGEQKGRLEHQIQSFRAGQDFWYIRASVVFENTGAVAIVPSRINTTLQQVLPLPGDLSISLRQGKRAVEPGSHEVNWPQVEDYDIDLREEDWTIEPGEVDSLEFDFVVPTSIQLVQIHTRLFESDSAESRFWEHAALVPLDEPGTTEADLRDRPIGGVVQ